MEGPHNTTSKGTGRRIIGQNAEHEIHLEIEDALDKKKFLSYQYQAKFQDNPTIPTPNNFKSKVEIICCVILIHIHIHPFLV